MRKLGRKNCASCGYVFIEKKHYGPKLWAAKKYCSSVCFGAATKSHGMAGTKIYGVWNGMLSRCNNPKVKAYKNYGGRGIRVCRRWLKFVNFYADMGDIPHGLSLDRKDNNKNYTPSNCKWSTQKEQCNNRRTSRLITMNGETMSLARWSEILGMSYAALSLRISRYGWSPERAFKTPVRVWPMMKALQG